MCKLWLFYYFLPHSPDFQKFTYFCIINKIAQIRNKRFTRFIFFSDLSQFKAVYIAINFIISHFHTIIVISSMGSSLQCYFISRGRSKLISSQHEKFLPHVVLRQLGDHFQEAYFFHARSSCVSMLTVTSEQKLNFSSHCAVSRGEKRGRARASAKILVSLRRISQGWVAINVGKFIHTA